MRSDYCTCGTHVPLWKGTVFEKSMTGTTLEDCSRVTAVERYGLGNEANHMVASQQWAYSWLMQAFRPCRACLRD